LFFGSSLTVEGFWQMVFQRRAWLRREKSGGEDDYGYYGEEKLRMTRSSSLNFP